MPLETCAGSPPEPLAPDGAGYPRPSTHKWQLEPGWKSPNPRPGHPAIAAASLELPLGRGRIRSTTRPQAGLFVTRLEDEMRIHHKSSLHTCEQSRQACGYSKKNS